MALPDTLKAYNRIRKILRDEWDPIGVKDMPYATDEYDRYAWHVCQLSEENVSSSKIFNYLRDIETNYIGLKGDQLLTRKIARKIFRYLKKLE